MRSSTSQINKILVVGFGSIGKRHIENIVNFFPTIEIGLLRHTKNVDSETQSYDVGPCFYSVEDALLFEPDAAVIANPSSLHLDIAMPLAGAGIHLLIEKPISNSLEDVKALINLCYKNNVKLMTGYNLRFLPSLNKLFELLNDNVVGELYSVHIEVGQYLPNWRPDIDYKETVSSQRFLGGGVLLELSHELNYAQWLFGDIKWVKATLLNQSNLEVDVEDSAHLQLGIDNRSNSKQLIATMNLDFIRHDTTRKCHVVGEKGSLTWDYILGTIEIFLPESKEWNVIYTDLNEVNFTYEKEIKNFISSIESNISPKISGEDGLKTLQIVEAARQSNSLNSRVVLDDLIPE